MDQGCVWFQHVYRNIPGIDWMDPQAFFHSTRSISGALRFGTGPSPPQPEAIAAPPITWFQIT